MTQSSTRESTSKPDPVVSASQLKGQGSARDGSICRYFWNTHIPRILGNGRDTTIPDLHGTAHFHVTGPGGGDWRVSVARGVVESITEGCPETSTVTITLSEEELLAIARGESDHREAFFQGRVLVEGNVELVLRAANLIPILREKFPFDPTAGE